MSSDESQSLRQATRQPPLGVLWIIIAASLTVHVLCLVASRTWMAGWVWPHEPFHATVEMAGGMIALGVAWILLSLDKLKSGTSHNVWISAALVGMGILDALHAMVHVGQSFVWLHSTATFAGGLLFSLVWLPAHWQPYARRWPHFVAATVLAFGLLSVAFPEYTPDMVRDGRFTGWATLLNVAGGILLFAAATRLVLSYRKNNNIDDLLFCLHCGLFGAAAVMFEQSQLWDVAWWGWHLLRLMAYSIALWFIVLTDSRTAAELRRRAATRARVAALEESAEMLEQANQQLQSEQYLMNTLAENIPDPVFFKNLKGEFIRVNNAMAHDAGISNAADMIGLTDSDIWAGNLPEETSVDEQRVIDTGVPIINKEEQPMLEGGPQRWVLVTKMPLIDPSGKTQGIFGVARDITDRKTQELALERHAEALAAAKSALERSNADLQQFAYVASHDLQEPLRAVVGYCQLLEAKLADTAGEDIKEYLHHATDGARRMQTLINSLLDYARVETRGSDFRPVDTEAMVQEAVSNLAVSISESGATIHNVDLPTVFGDRNQLVRLFQNLISNAIKFRGSDTPVVRIDAAESEGQWTFSVSDNGIGIEPKYSKQIFLIFQRLHTRTQYPGTGLGLAISMRIVERHGGTIWVESEPDEGCTFKFTIPTMTENDGDGKRSRTTS